LGGAEVGDGQPAHHGGEGCTDPDDLDDQPAPLARTVVVTGGCCRRPPAGLGRGCGRGAHVSSWVRGEFSPRGAGAADAPGSRADVIVSSTAATGITPR